MIERSWGNSQQGFRRMAAKKKPAGIRSLVYGMDKGKVRIEGLGVSVGPDGLEPSTHGLKVRCSTD